MREDERPWERGCIGTLVRFYQDRGGVLSEKFGGGVWPASQKPYPIYDKNCDIPYPIYDLNPVQTNVKLP